MDGTSSRSGHKGFLEVQLSSVDDLHQNDVNSLEVNMGWEKFFILKESQQIS
jgi:hypothetical protein